MSWVDDEIKRCEEAGDTSSPHYLGLLQQRRADQKLAALRAAGREFGQTMVERAHADLDAAAEQIRADAPRRLAYLDAVRRSNEEAAARHAAYALSAPLDTGLADPGEVVGVPGGGWERLAQDAQTQPLPAIDVDRLIEVEGDPDSLEAENRALGAEAAPVAQLPTTTPRGRRRGRIS